MCLNKALLHTQFNACYNELKAYVVIEGNIRNVRHTSWLYSTNLEKATRYKYHKSSLIIFNIYNKMKQAYIKTAKKHVT